jgi:hypothetical protein
MTAAFTESVVEQAPPRLARKHRLAVNKYAHRPDVMLLVAHMPEAQEAGK